ncbi:hypothetical protein [Bacillus atrophaeus]|nr:hypothetical protein [Bacillus atrophaeus]
MFEPILDMSDLHLKQFYYEILELLTVGEELAHAEAYVAATGVKK